MLEFWETLNIFQKVFFVAAAPASLVMILQALLSLVGIGGHFDFHIGDLHAEDGFGDDIGFLNLRGILAFFVVGGWVGFFMSSSNIHPLLIIAGALAFGTAALISVTLIIRKLMVLQESGNLKTENAIGHEGEVYLTIPAKAENRGKVNLLLQDRYVELEAITVGENELKTGTKVSVVDVDENGVLLVEESFR